MIRLFAGLFEASAGIWPIAAIMLLHGLVTHRTGWIIMGSLFAVLEFVFAVTVRAAVAQTEFSAVDEIFNRYENCTFRQVSLESYFGEDTQNKDFLKIKNDLKISKQHKSVLRSMFPAIPHAPQDPYIIAVSKNEPGECLETPVTYYTGLGVYIFVPDLPIDDAINIRFMIRHEIGHIAAEQPRPFREQAIMTASLWLRLTIALPLLVPLNFFSGALIACIFSLFWDRSAAILDEQYLSEASREIVADKYAIARLSEDDCVALRETFLGELRGRVTALNCCDLPNENNRDFSVSETALLRWQAGLENINRKLAKQEIENLPLGFDYFPFPRYLCISILLLLLAVMPWRWLEPSRLSVYVIAGAVLGILFFSWKTVWAEQNRAHTLCNQRAPEITAEEWAEATAEHFRRRELESAF